jgi:hypothetical protein
MANDSRQAGGQIEITPQMIEAGVERLCDLPLAEVDPTYVVSEVLAAMGLLVARRSEEGSQEPPHDEIPNSLSAG